MMNTCKFRCCTCKQRLRSFNEVDTHKIPDKNNVKHVVVPIIKCIYCHGCD